MSRRTWYLVRHGETEWNAAGRMQGQWDSSLTPLGREHARNSARLLARMGIDALFASPLGRVRETIAIVQEELSGSGHTPPAVVFDDRLKEWSAGIWQGELHADLAGKWPDEVAAWHADRYAYRPPGGENFGDLVDRASGFLTDLAAIPGSNVAIVAHGFLNRALAAVLLSLPPEEMLRIHQTNDTVIRIVTAGGTREADHFVGGDGPRPGLPGTTKGPVARSLV